LGLLIHAALGILGGDGRRAKRAGLAAYAAVRTACLFPWIAAAVPMCKEYGVCRPMPEW
jgi:hypothetical protein